MSRYHTRDIKFTEEGDFALDDQHDLQLAEREELIEQNIRIPMQITNPDWESDPIGADLEDLIGMENTPQTAEYGKLKITGAFTKTEFFNEEDLWIEAKPLNASTILFFVFVNSPYHERPLVYEINMDLGFGSTTRRVS